MFVEIFALQHFYILLRYLLQSTTTILQVLVTFYLKNYLIDLVPWIEDWTTKALKRVIYDFDLWSFYAAHLLIEMTKYSYIWIIYSFHSIKRTISRHYIILIIISMNTWNKLCTRKIRIKFCTIILLNVSLRICNNA